MYTPLIWIDQLKNYFLDENMVPVESENQRALEWGCKRARQENLADMFHLMFNDMDLFSKSDICTDLKRDFASYVGKWLNQIPNRDLTQLWQQYYFYEHWRYHKTAYRLHHNIANSLMEMNFPNISANEYFKLNDKVFYFDLEDMENAEDICTNLKGFFVLPHYNETHHVFTMSFLLLCLDPKNHNIVPLHDACRCFVDISEDGEQALQCKIPIEAVTFHTEFGNATLHSYRLLRLFLNFLLYLKASNTDTQPSVRTIKAHDKKPQAVGTPTKDKFREVKEYELGFRIFRDQPKVRYVRDKASSSVGLGGKKSSYFRSAHWHNYWVGSEKDGTRHLELRWVEETFVNGRGSQVAVIKDIKDKE